MREFFGLDVDGGGYNRPAEGFLSWQHLVFVTSCVLVMTGLSIFLGLRNRNKDMKTKNKVIIWSAILIDAFEIFKIILISCRSNDPMAWTRMLPLFLCSIQLIAIPVAAFSKGRFKESALDFVFIFGILGALLGTYGAGQNYGCYPVLSFDNVVSAITHCISGFASLYIAISKMTSMKTKNMWITATILFVFFVLAYIANVTIPYNYMFLMRGDGTPYDIIYNLVNGNKIIYPLLVLLLFYVYASVFYLIYFLVGNKKIQKSQKGEMDDDSQEDANELEVDETEQDAVEEQIAN